jgi:site-specific recombinase XerD
VAQRTPPIKTCFSCLRRMGIIEVNVFQRVPLVKMRLTIKAPFNVAEVKRLLDRQNRDTYGGCRNYALLLFLLDSGVRASQCVDVQLDDVNWEAGRVFVRHGKGEKQRWVGVGSRTVDALLDYVGRFRGDAPGALFQTMEGADFTGPHTLNVLLACQNWA